jgi:hypothetical protein
MALTRYCDWRMKWLYKKVAGHLLRAACVAGTIN